MRTLLRRLAARRLPMAELVSWVAWTAHEAFDDGELIERWGWQDQPGMAHALELAFVGLCLLEFEQQARLACVAEEWGDERPAEVLTRAVIARMHELGVAAWAIEKENAA